ncbi:MAG TPA: TIGR03915 family putative DNA repair protein [Candidatus Wallbacteria bacterium]|nr:TIGR03915 family putative DNA repair protein [Candidatus Wallbacteria bacterium]
MGATYIYDDSFDGLLTALFTAHCAAVKPEAIAAESEFEDGLFAEKITVKTDPDMAAGAVNIISNFISLDAMHNIFYAFLAESENHGGVIYDYFSFGVEKGRAVDKFLHDPRVIGVHKLRDKLHCEKHRLLGLIRFKKVETGTADSKNPAGHLYYASIEPDNNVIGLVAPHFAHRLPGEPWMIHDLKRGIAALNNGQGRGANWSIVDISLNAAPQSAEKEDLYQDLWRAFLKSLVIETRINPKLQKRCMPVRYWKHLVEMSK